MLALILSTLMSVLMVDATPAERIFNQVARGNPTQDPLLTCTGELPTNIADIAPGFQYSTLIELCSATSIKPNMFCQCHKTAAGQTYMICADEQFATTPAIQTAIAYCYSNCNCGEDPNQQRWVYNGVLNALQRFGRTGPVVITPGRPTDPRIPPASPWEIAASGGGATTESPVCSTKCTSGTAALVAAMHRKQACSSGTRRRVGPARRSPTS